MKNKKKLYLTEKLKLDDKKIKEHISSWSYETKGQDGNPIIKQKKKQSYTPFDVPKKSRLKGLKLTWPHREHGGKPSRKGKYTQQAFKQHNELKLLNSLQGKYQSDAQRREFESLNEEALREAGKRAKEKVNKIHGTYHGRPKYGGMIYGNSDWYKNKYDIDAPDLPDTSFHLGGRPYGDMVGYGRDREEKEKIVITWDQPREKDPGADYKPGKFKHLDEAIRNTKNGQR